MEQNPRLKKPKERDLGFKRLMERDPAIKATNRKKFWNQTDGTRLWNQRKEIPDARGTRSYRLFKNNQLRMFAALRIKMALWLEKGLWLKALWLCRVTLLNCETGSNTRTTNLNVIVSWPPENKDCFIKLEVKLTTHPGPSICGNVSFLWKCAAVLQKHHDSCRFLCSCSAGWYRRRQQSNPQL